MVDALSLGCTLAIGSSNGFRRRKRANGVNNAASAATGFSQMLIVSGKHVISWGISFYFLSLIVFVFVPICSSIVNLIGLVFLLLLGLLESV